MSFWFIIVSVDFTDVYSGSGSYDWTMSKIPRNPSNLFIGQIWIHPDILVNKVLWVPFLLGQNAVTAIRDATCRFEKLCNCMNTVGIWILNMSYTIQSLHPSGPYFWKGLYLYKAIQTNMLLTLKSTARQLLLNRLFLVFFNRLITLQSLYVNKDQQDYHKYIIFIIKLYSNQGLYHCIPV